MTAPSNLLALIDPFPNDPPRPERTKLDRAELN